jgi:rRNA processing protein Gar1
MSSSPNSVVGAIYADEKPTRRAVSISSVDSEPIARRASSRSASSTASNGDGGHGRGWVIPDGDDVVLDTETAVDMPASISLEEVSEAPVAVVHSTSTASHSCVAEAVPEALSMNIGTRLCLADGTIIGCITSVLGPVKRAFYVVKSMRDDFDELLTSSRLAEGTLLHYDLTHQEVIFDPFGQCDAAKGTDASYVNDEELPEHVRPDFSDDEKEMEWKRLKRQRVEGAESVSSDEPQEEIEWSKLDLGDDAPQRTDDAHIVVPPWLQTSGNRSAT